MSSSPSSAYTARCDGHGWLNVLGPAGAVSLRIRWPGDRATSPGNADAADVVDDHFAAELIGEGADRVFELS
jgi:hypothetical protein